MRQEPIENLQPHYKKNSIQKNKWKYNFYRNIYFLSFSKKAIKY